MQVQGFQGAGAPLGKAAMPPRTLRLALIAAALVGVGAYYYVHARPTALVLTGVVTTDDTIVSAQLPGRLGRLLVKAGDAVTRGQLLAVIAPDELRAESDYYAQAAEGAGSTVKGNESAVRFEARQTESQIRQAEAALAAAEASERAGEADLERARLAFERMQRLVKAEVVSAGEFDQVRTDYDATKARVASLQAGGIGAGRGGAGENQRRTDCRAAQPARREPPRSAAAAGAQRQKADVRLTYTETVRRSTASSTCAPRAKEKSSPPGSRSSPSSIPTISGSASTSKRPTSTACGWAIG